MEPWIETLWPALHKELSGNEEQVVNCVACFSQSHTLPSDTDKMDALNGASLLYSPALESVSLTLPPKQAEFLSLEYVDPRPNEVSDSRMKFRDPRRWGAGKQLHRILSFFSGPSRLTRNTI